MAGISGDDYQNAATFNHGFHTAAIACAVLLALGGVVAGVGISNDKAAQQLTRSRRVVPLDQPRMAANGSQ